MTRMMRLDTGRDDADLASFPPLPRDASVGKRWKFRRNVVIYVGHRSGISQRVLAEVFDLPRSRIAAIVKQFSAFDRDRRADRPRTPVISPTPEPANGPGGGPFGR